MQWNDSYQENIFCLPTIFRNRTAVPIWPVSERADAHPESVHGKEGIASEAKVNATGDDAREGLTAVLSVKVPDPKFSSQTKDKLVSSEVKGMVEATLGEKLHELSARTARRCARDYVENYRSAPARAKPREKPVK